MMGRRYFDEYKPAWVTFSETWGNVPHIGRWYKRRLSKARRRYVRDLLRFGRAKEPTGIESEVNWKGW
jgi:hypothetical protein